MGCGSAARDHFGAGSRPAGTVAAAVAGYWRGGCLGADRARSRCVDESGIRRRRGLEPTDPNPRTEPLAGRNPGAPSAAARRRASTTAAVYDPGKHSATQLRAVRFEAGRASRLLSALFGQFLAANLRSAGRADPDDAAQG